MLDRLERAFEQIVEGSIARVFRLRVQPAEIGRQLERAMLAGRVTSVGVTLAPNRYEVRLHPEDAGAFADWTDALSREMEAWLAELAYARGLATVGEIRVQIAEDDRVRRRSVQATARFGAEPKPMAPPDGALPDPLRLIPTTPGVAGARLTPPGISVGRAEGNDLAIPDPRVSRRHARIEPDGPGWRVVDLGSTNGTWVNGARISSSSVVAGDVLEFGGVRFTLAAG